MEKKNSVNNSSTVHFVGVWDTVGAMGLPFTIFGLIKDKHLFYDKKLGSNIKTARHALSLDERRNDFEPTIWDPKPGVNLKQVWFSGVHADIGGSYKPDSDGTFLSDIPMMWLLREAKATGLAFESYLSVSNLNSCSRQHNEYKGKYKLLGKYEREIPDIAKIPTKVHISVQQRYANSNYKSTAIENYLNNNNGQWPAIEH